MRRPKSRTDKRASQIGEYWLSKRPGYEGAGDSWYRTWYDAAARQTRRISLGDSDFGRAADALLDWYLRNRRPEKAALPDVLLDEIFVWYWEDHGKHLPSADTEKRNIALWRRFWKTDTVGDVNRARQAEFRKKLAEWRPKLGRGGIDRILTTGRSAIYMAEKLERIESAPKIYLQQTKEEKRASKPKAPPVSIDELARLFDDTHSAHAFMYLMLAVGTLARPGAILQLGPKQYDADYQLLALNPAGRVQNRKRRPTLPVAPTLRPWLEHADGDTYVQFRGRPLKTIRGVFRGFTETLGKQVAPYSIRHGIGRMMQSRKVPRDQIQLFYGHLPNDETTAIYAPYDPDYLAEAVAAIEDVFQKVAALCKRSELILRPKLVVGGDPLLAVSQEIQGGIGEEKRLEVRKLILERVPHAEIVRRTGVSDGTVSSIRQALAKTVTLLRITK